MVAAHADTPATVSLQCAAGVEVLETPGRGTVTTAPAGDERLLVTYTPDPTATTTYVADVVFASASGRGGEYRQRFVVEPVPLVRPTVTLAVPEQPVRRVLRRGVEATVACACRFTATVRVGTRDVATVAGEAGTVRLPLDRAAKRQLRRSRHPAVRVAVVPEGFGKATVTWAGLTRKFR